MGRGRGRENALERGRGWSVALSLSLGLLLLAAPVAAAPLPTLFGEPVARGGWHVQVAFGWGGGPTSHGLLHNMEIGRTFGARGYTLAFNHVFVLSDGLTDPKVGSDMFGGHLLVFKMPLLFEELTAKVALGLGENVDLGDGFDPAFGLGWLYGLELDLPLTRASGMTVGVMAFHAVTVDVGHQVAGGAYLGYNWF